jgi:biopolymer transport protein ExbD
MAEINENGLKKRKARVKKPFVKVDMTPMVDLAFLLLTFFILTTTLSEQKNLEILLPPDNGTTSDVNNAVTVILSANDKLYYYTGQLKAETTLTESDFKNIRDVIQHQNDTVYNNLYAFTRKYS